VAAEVLWWEDAEAEAEASCIHTCTSYIMPPLPAREVGGTFYRPPPKSLRRDVLNGFGVGWCWCVVFYAVREDDRHIPPLPLQYSV
jgi:hypothetical protein